MTRLLARLIDTACLPLIWAIDLLAPIVDNNLCDNCGDPDHLTCRPLGEPNEHAPEDES